MPFQPESNLPDFDSLKPTFVAAEEQIGNYTLFQTIIRILNSSQKMKTIFKKDIDDLEVEVAAADVILSDTLNPFLLMGG